MTPFPPSASSMGELSTPMPTNTSTSAANSSNASSMASGVSWGGVDFSKTQHKLMLVFLILQVLAFFLALHTVRLVYTQFKRNRSNFWKSSLNGTILLVFPPWFEIGFTLALWSKQTLLPWPPYFTFIGDIFARCGYATITICRFWRLKLISPSHPTTALKYFRIMAACIAFATAISLYSAAAVRIVETVENEWGVVRYSDSNKRVNSYRNQDIVLGLVCFMMVHACNLLCDVLFAQTIFSSVRKTADKRVELTHGERLKLIWPYIPPATVTFTYLFTSILGIIDPQIEHVIFFSISIGRLAPVIESWTFYAFAINHTRLMLKNLSKTGSYSHSQTDARSAGIISAPSDAPRLPPALAFSVNASHTHSHPYSHHKTNNSSFSNSIINTSSLTSAPPGYEAHNGPSYPMSPVSPRSAGPMSPTSRTHGGHDMDGYRHQAFEHQNQAPNHEQHHYQQNRGGQFGHNGTNDASGNPSRPNVRRFS